MKMLALSWLHSRGAKVLSVEGDYEGGRYDAACEDLGVVVECGTTRIDKLFSVALSTAWREFVVIPRIIDIAVIFEFHATPWNFIRRSASSVCDRVGFLTEVL